MIKLLEPAFDALPIPFLRNLAAERQADLDCNERTGTRCSGPAFEWSGLRGPD
jgi:hypothetical protein